MILDIKEMYLLIIEQAIMKNIVIMLKKYNLIEEF